MFGETDAIVRLKVDAAVRNDMTPILCVGEAVALAAEEASAFCISQLEAALRPRAAADAGRHMRVVVAYEPVWAIGADAPAPVEHIRRVCSAIRGWMDRSAFLAAPQVIYGGSADRGLLTALDGSVDGLFLGRFAHDPDNLAEIVAEASELML
jgi:triosephosphate isomerase